MSEIEKMYENAGVELNEGLEWVCKNPDHCTYQNLSIVPENCSDCEYFEREMVYPPFTAEKQLELIKFITSLGVCEIENWNDKGFHFAIKRERIYPTIFLSLSNINLQETLADVINNLWQDLTEEEKQQIKEILE